MDTIYSNINDLYNKSTFLEKHGSELYITIFLILLTFVLYYYFNTKTRIKQIKANWAAERCKPSVIPFAGLINSPEGTNKLHYAANNFNECLNMMLEDVANLSLQPVYSILTIIPKMINELIDSLNSIRKTLYDKRNNIESTSTNIYSRFTNITIPFIQFIINTKDTIAKTHGILTSSVFTLFGGYLTLRAAIESIAKMLVNFLVMLVGFIVTLWIIPFLWPAAGAMTATAAAISAPLILMVMSMNRIFNLSVGGIPKLPKKPRCFDALNLIQLQNGTFKEIYKLNVGDKLFNNSTVTGIMECSTADHEFYNVNGVVVTGSHKIFIPDKKWINVKDYDKSILIKDYNKPLMYCINTDNKLIEINNLIFNDWDEFDDECLEEFKKKYTNHTMFRGAFDTKILHKYFEGGFIKGTKIKLINNKEKNIENILVNDILKNNEKVLAIVKINANDIMLYKYNIRGNIFIGGPNILFLDKNLELIDTLNIEKNNIKVKQKYNLIYHLITDKGYYTLTNEIKCSDYNYTTDRFINNRNKGVPLSLF